MFTLKETVNLLGAIEFGNDVSADGTRSIKQLTLSDTTLQGTVQWIKPNLSNLSISLYSTYYSHSQKCFENGSMNFSTVMVETPEEAIFFERHCGIPAAHLKLIPSALSDSARCKLMKNYLAKLLPMKSPSKIAKLAKFLSHVLQDDPSRRNILMLTNYLNQNLYTSSSNVMEGNLELVEYLNKLFPDNLCGDKLLDLACCMNDDPVIRFRAKLGKADGESHKHVVGSVSLMRKMNTLVPVSFSFYYDGEMNKQTYSSHSMSRNIRLSYQLFISRYDDLKWFPPVLTATDEECIFIRKKFGIPAFSVEQDQTCKNWIEENIYGKKRVLLPSSFVESLDARPLMGMIREIKVFSESDWDA